MEIHVVNGLGWLISILVALYSLTTLINLIAMPFRVRIEASRGPLGSRLRAFLRASQSFGSDLREFVVSLNAAVRGVPWSEKGAPDQGSSNAAKQEDVQSAKQPGEGVTK